MPKGKRKIAHASQRRNGWIGGRLRDRLPSGPKSVSRSWNSDRTRHAFKDASRWVRRQKLKYKRNSWVRLCCGAFLSGSYPQWGVGHSMSALLLSADSDPLAFGEPHTLFTLLEAASRPLHGPPTSKMSAPFISLNHRTEPETELLDYHLSGSLENSRENSHIENKSSQKVDDQEVSDSEETNEIFNSTIGPPTTPERVPRCLFEPNSATRIDFVNAYQDSHQPHKKTILVLDNKISIPTDLNPNKSHICRRSIRNINR